MSDNESEIGAFMAGFVIGGLIGAATALILAPQSGAETRAKIAATGDEWRRASQHQWQETRGRVQATSDQVQERTRIVLDEGKDRIADALDKSKSRVSDAQEEIADQEQEDESAQGDAAV